MHVSTADDLADHVPRASYSISIEHPGAGFSGPYKRPRVAADQPGFPLRFAGARPAIKPIHMHQPRPAVGQTRVGDRTALRLHALFALALRFARLEASRSIALSLANC